MYSIVYSDSEKDSIEELFCPDLSISIEVAEYIVSKSERVRIYNAERPSDSPLVTL